jgi:hypothetical protein
MSHEILTQAAQRFAPGAGTATAITTTAHGAIELTPGGFYWFQAKTARIHLRFGPTTTLTATAATDIWLEPNEREEFYIGTGQKYVDAVASASATLVFVQVG